MNNVKRVMLPGQTWGLVAPGADGPILATSYEGKNLAATVLVAIDMDGQTVWRRTFDGHPGRPRMSGNATVWIAHRGPDGAVFTELDVEGTVVREIVPEHDVSEHLGAFAVLRDGICVSWLPAKTQPPCPSGSTRPRCPPRSGRFLPVVDAGGPGSTVLPGRGRDERRNQLGSPAEEALDAAHHRGALLGSAARLRPSCCRHVRR